MTSEPQPTGTDDELRQEIMTALGDVSCGTCVCPDGSHWREETDAVWERVVRPALERLHAALEETRQSQRAWIKRAEEAEAWLSAVAELPERWRTLADDVPDNIYGEGQRVGLRLACRSLVRALDAAPRGEEADGE